MIYTENYMNQKTVFGTESSMVGWGWNLPRDAETQREREFWVMKKWWFLQN